MANTRTDVCTQDIAQPDTKENVESEQKLILGPQVWKTLEADLAADQMSATPSKIVYLRIPLCIGFDMQIESSHLQALVASVIENANKIASNHPDLLVKKSIYFYCNQEAQDAVRKFLADNSAIYSSIDNVTIDSWRKDNIVRKDIESKYNVYRQKYDQEIQSLLKKDGKRFIDKYKWEPETAYNYMLDEAKDLLTWLSDQLENKTLNYVLYPQKLYHVMTHALDHASEIGLHNTLKTFKYAFLKEVDKKIEPLQKTKAKQNYSDLKSFVEQVGIPVIEQMHDKMPAGDLGALVIAMYNAAAEVPKVAKNPNAFFRVRSQPAAPTYANENVSMKAMSVSASPKPF